MSELSATQQRALAELLQLTPVINELGTLFRNAGHQLYLVGGSVRDALLGRLGNDLDFTTSAPPDKTQALLESYTNAVWDVGKNWGTIAAKKTTSNGSSWLIEITTFRADTYHKDSRKPSVKYGDNIADDLVRRDFTSNAMAIDVSHPSGTPQLIDPYDGLEDLADHLIRTPAAPELSFSDDPLRIMRAARFASQLKFKVTPDVQAAMKAMAERITIISAERVQAELTKLLLTDSPARGLDLLVSTGVAEYVLPELPALQLERDEHAMHKDIYAHSLVVLQQAIELEHTRRHSPDIITRLAALLHDIGKPATKRIIGGKVSFLYHDIVGAKLVRKRLRALKYPNEIVDAVAQLVEQHLRFHGYGEQEWTDSAVRRYVHDAGSQLERLHILTRADCTTRNAAKATRLRRTYDELEFRIDELKKQEELDAIRPDLDGLQIMELLGIAPGALVGEAYRFLLERRMAAGPLGAERAREELLRWWADRSKL
ncbi:MAG: CCA tRNA nucleotidyltransferase [Propionibacteriaceae bacterium]|jgi:poly(A) polymerase|nr:CCA tRNA nucleotidyltransferase [Propionibacteriaceae bacterium]